MSEAYQCERCGEYKDGSGEHTRYGIYKGTSGFTPDYDFQHSVELCDDCKERLDARVETFLDSDDEV